MASSSILRDLSISCGVNDYFEDFINAPEDINKTFSVKVKYIEPNDSQSFRVRHSFKNDFSIDDQVLFQEFLDKSYPLDSTFHQTPAEKT